MGTATVSQLCALHFSLGSGKIDPVIPQRILRRLFRVCCLDFHRLLFFSYLTTTAFRQHVRLFILIKFRECAQSDFAFCIRIADLAWRAWFAAQTDTWMSER